MVKADFVIAGAGVMGISIALSLKKRYPKSSIHILEKEDQISVHASGRNSGVLHAGFYYSPDSLKARFTREGNERLTNYCLDRKLKVNRCGKLVVTQTEEELESLDELARRGSKNGVVLEPVTLAQARKIEPRVKTVERALFSPNTSSIDPKELMQSLVIDLKAADITIHYGSPYVGSVRQKKTTVIKTPKETFECGYFINAAGLYADRIAKDFGFSKHYRILPFKGLYLYSNEKPGALKTNIYPVPNLKNPFLGVHFTLTADGHVKIGPTAIPAFWREQYSGLKRFRVDELFEVGVYGMGLLFSSGFDFTKLAVEEITKYSRSKMVRLAQNLIEGVDPKNYTKWGKPGIRAQLLDTRSKTLEMDFVVEGDTESFHVLNAVSPGLTCSQPFADYVVEQIQEAKAS